MGAVLEAPAQGLVLLAADVHTHGALVEADADEVGQFRRGGSPPGSRAVEEDLVGGDRLGDIQLCEGVEGDSVAVGAGADVLCADEVEGAQQVGPGLPEAVGVEVYGVSGVGGAGDVEVVGVEYVLNLQIRAVPIVGGHLVKLDIGAVVAETHLVPYRKQHVPLHQKHLVGMVEHRTLLHQTVSVEVLRYVLGVHSSQLQTRHFGHRPLREADVQDLPDGLAGVGVVDVDLGRKAEVVGQSHGDCFFLVEKGVVDGPVAGSVAAQPPDLPQESDGRNKDADMQAQHSKIHITCNI